MNIQTTPTDELANDILNELKEIMTVPEECDITTEMYGMGADSLVTTELEMILEVKYKLENIFVGRNDTCRSLSLQLKRLDDAAA